MTTATSNKSFANLANGDLNFANISADETDVFSGTSGVTSFTANSGDPSDYVAGSETGMSWSGVAVEAYSDATGDPSTQTLNISYDVSVSNSAEFITAIDSSYAVDLQVGNGQLVAVESIYDTNGDLLGTQTFTSGAAAPAPTQLSMGVQNAVVALQLTLTASSPNADIEASIISQAFAQTAGTALATLGDYVWMDSNGNGLQDSGETGVSGVLVELLNGSGTSVIAVTTTNATGFYAFTGLLSGTYEVKFVAPGGDNFTTASVGANPAIYSSANQSTGVTAPVTLTAGETDNNVDAGLVGVTGITLSSGGISVNKVPGSMVINACGQETYSFAVTNTGGTAVTNLVLQDNIGTAAKPDIITPTLVTSGFNGTLAPGATVDYSVTSSAIDDSASCRGTVSSTCSGANLGAGNTAWFSCSFTPTSTANGTCYVFKGVQCQLSGGGTGPGGYTVACPDAVVTFSSSCKQACTTYNASTNCWVTTLPANCNPGNVFLTGCPVTVPAGGFNNAACAWSIADSGNNCGSGSVSWNASCQGYSSFDQNGLNGCANYNNIGVKVCDNSYGNGGSTGNGYGSCNGGYTAWGWGGGGFGVNNGDGWLGSGSDCAGTPENQYTSGNCGSSGGFAGCGESGGYGGFGDGCGGAPNTGGCGTGGSGSCTQTQVGATGVADTVTVTGTAAGATVTASDTAEIIVLGSPNNVSVNGTTPTGSLSALYGKAQTLEFTYNPGTTVSTKTVSIGASTGSTPGSMAFIAISNNSTPNATGAQIYFEGTVASGQKLYADASINSLTNTANTGAAAFMSTVAGQGIYADIYASQAAFLAGSAPVQVDTYNTSGSQAMYCNDQVGSLTVAGYVGSTGGHLIG